MWKSVRSFINQKKSTKTSYVYTDIFIHICALYRYICTYTYTYVYLYLATYIHKFYKDKHVKTYISL